MPTKRRKISARGVAIPPQAIEAWRRGDFKRLHRACGLSPGQLSPFPSYLTPIGVDPGRKPDGADDPMQPWRYSWHRAVELQRALIEIAGDPPDELLPVDETVVPFRWRDG